MSMTNVTPFQVEPLVVATPLVLPAGEPEVEAPPTAPEVVLDAPELAAATDEPDGAPEVAAAPDPDEVAEAAALVAECETPEVDEWEDPEVTPEVPRLESVVFVPPVEAPLAGGLDSSYIEESVMVPEVPQAARNPRAANVYLCIGGTLTRFSVRDLCERVPHTRLKSAEECAFSLIVRD
jgi:hypothetical protein